MALLRVGCWRTPIRQQLALLRKDRIVTTRREAQTVYYDLAREDVRQLMGFLYETYCGVPA